MSLPRDNGNGNNAAAANNGLTTEFFFDTGGANFDTTAEFTPSKRHVDARKTQRPPHSSLLATPLNRSSGGEIKKNPSPSILNSKYLSKAPAPITNKSTTKVTSSPAIGEKSTLPLSAGKGATSSPTPTYSTPLSKKITAAATAGRATTTTTPPSASLVNASSNIKARLRQLAATSPITTPGSNGQSSSYSHISDTPTTTTPFTSLSATRDFRISAAIGSRASYGTTPHSAESLAARSRANQMQAELHLRDLEVHKLAAAAAEARKERDEQKLRADKLEAIAARISPSPRGGIKSTSTYAGHINSTTTSIYQILPQQAQHAPADSPSRSTTPASTSRITSEDAQTALFELRRESETLRRQVEMAASELQGQRARADAAEERWRLAEARAGAESSAHEAKENELRSLRQKVASMQNEVRRLATDLAGAEDRAGLAETALAEERSRSRGGNGGNGYNSSSNNISSASLTEVALTAQVRALAAQLKVAKNEVVTAHQELTSYKAEHQGQNAVHEDTTASILSANRELEAALAQASQNLEQRGEELQQARGAVTRLAAENAALHAALKDRDEQYSASLAASQNQHPNSEHGMARAHAAETQLTATQHELKLAKTRIADLEHAISKNHHNSNRGLMNSSTGNQDSIGPSPLRDIVGSLRTELEDRELRLAAAEEELASERRRAADLHRQVLDQAVEIEDLQRETYHGDDILRKELDQARKEAHAAAQELAELRQRQNEAAVGGSASVEELKELQKERDALREELDARETEVMALQGQLNMLVTMHGRGAGGGVGGGEVENWLMGP